MQRGLGISRLRQRIGQSTDLKVDKGTVAQGGCLIIFSDQIWLLERKEVGEGGRDGSRGRQGSGGEGVLTKPLQRSCYELVVNLCILQGGGLGPGNCVATERVALIQP